MADEEEARIPGERAETITDQRIDSNPAVKRGAIALAVVAFIGFAIWSTSGNDNKNQRTDPERVIIRQTNAFEPAKEKAEPVSPVPVPKTVLPIPALEPVPEMEDKLLDSARRAPVLAYSREQGKSPVRRAGDDPAQSIDGNFLPLDSNAMSQGQVSNDEQRFDSLLRPTRLEGARAGTLGNRNFIVAMGNSIPCVLETALASDQPGFTSCIINRDVLSDNGRVVLMEKGTQVVGEFRGGLQRGQKRLLVLWNRAKTPEGVIITLASPATDALGRSGFDGHVDRHWWERFGSALLLSIVGDATGYASNRLQNSGVEAQNTMSAGQHAAAIAVEKSIDIPPTLNKHQGEIVSIFVARDLDFSDVYRLRVAEPKNRIFDRAVLGDFKPESKVVTK
ncbi:type IV secretion system protein virB10 [Brucella sp. NBRC 12951]|uniref:Type IV secretion system protein virB10 n=2 Tax=Pseudomonadota TaxID=1224 RepID=A0A8I0N1V3_BRUAN|nr:MULTISPECIES: type IV secretion system protein VirB10 [Brucella/Ochrobactrum group]MBA8862710.1 type IV secretion system protein VirB10 [Brucella anthropi]MBE0559967.1 type IV secretion system protein VirB10 [Brucella anthropi]PQZ64200.1 type IV secretion system protein VirB10 [Ochrobactrum sp. MYb49]QTN05609.1 type IV secretion system protein VirB10 [Ochrobactrum sp. EEELCW01]